jgi:hypothetical protein
MRTSFLALFLLASCGDPNPITETGNPNMTMSYRATTSDSARVSIDGGPASSLALASVWVSIGDVRFVEGGLCDTPQEVEHDAPGITADLLTNPEPVVFKVAAADYCRVRVRLDKADDVAGAPSDLADHSIRVTGERADGVPVTLLSRTTAEIDLRSRGEPFSLSDARDRLVLAFDVGAWFAGIDLSTAEVSNGEIRINDDDNKDLLDDFDAAVENALALYDDADRDGDPTGDDELAESE